MIGPELAQCSPLIGPGVPVPEEPFPNDTAEMRGNIARIRRTCVLLWSGAALGLGAAAYCLRDLLPRPRLVFQ